MPGDYMKPCKVREDSAGRKLDAAGKLIVQPARPELKKTKGVDPNRQIGFKNV